MREQYERQCPECASLNVEEGGSYLTDRRCQDCDAQWNVTERLLEAEAEEDEL